MSGSSPLVGMIAKLGRLTPLEQADRDALLALPFELRQYPPLHYLVRDGEAATSCSILLDGYACCSKITSAGARQIMSFHMPGDILDLQHLLLTHADHNVQVITRATVARVLAADLRRVAQERPTISEALWRDTLIDSSIFREWVLNVGRRSAKARIAHLLCEFAARRAAAGLGSLDRFELPMTQELIGDACGLTSVHVNRMLRELTGEGVIARDKCLVVITDWARMRHIADFDTSYLHAVA